MEFSILEVELRKYISLQHGKSSDFNHKISGEEWLGTEHIRMCCHHFPRDTFFGAPILLHINKVHEIDVKL